MLIPEVEYCFFLTKIIRLSTMLHSGVIKDTCDYIKAACEIMSEQWVQL